LPVGDLDGTTDDLRLSHIPPSGKTPQTLDRLDLSRFNPLDFSNYRAIIEEGYRQASEQVG
jgi:hypothetical protein